MHLKDLLLTPGLKYTFEIHELIMLNEIRYKFCSIHIYIQNIEMLGTET